MGNLQTQPLILASSSIYRRDLLARLGLPFEAISPEVDERALPNEGVAAMALRLAIAKAAAIAKVANVEKWTLREAALASGYVSAYQFDSWVKPVSMTRVS